MMTRRQNRRQSARYEVQDSPHRLRDHCKRLAVALRNREPMFRRVVDEGKNVLLHLLWKQRLSPLDNSNVLICMNTPAHLISPKKPFIHCLPLDVLCHIFSFVVHSDCVRPEDRFKKEIWRNFVSSGSSPTSPVVLGHVCRFWRTFVHGNPLLWATIFVHSPVARHVSAVAFWLEKSKDCPLDLRFEQFVTPDQPSCDIANLFIAHAHRWRRISFVLSIKQFPFFQDLNIGDLPLLESFRIRLPRWDRRKCAHAVDVLLSSPVLHTINWGKSTFGTLPASTPWAQLQEISFHNILLSDTVLSHLALCANLRALNLYQIHVPVAGSVLPVSLPHLERLVCERSHCGALNCFILPNLRELIGGFPYMNKPDASVTSLCDLIERSECQLRTLEIESEIMSMLPRSILDHVENLHIPFFSYWHLSSLIVRPGKTSVLPCLRNLFIGRYDAQDGTLAAMAMSRSNSLRMLCVGIDPQLCPRDNSILRRLKKDGLTVQITEPLYQSQVVSYSRVDSAPDCDSPETSTLRLPDFDTLWT